MLVSTLSMPCFLQSIPQNLGETVYTAIIKQPVFPVNTFFRRNLASIRNKKTCVLFRRRFETQVR